MSTKKPTSKQLQQLMGYGISRGSIKHTLPIVLESAVDEVLNDDGTVLVAGVKEVLADKILFPIFEIKNPTNKEMKTIRLAVKADDSIDEQDQIYKVLNFAVVGWDNLIDPNTGELIEFNTNIIDELSIKTATALFIFISKQLGLI